MLAIEHKKVEAHLAEPLKDLLVNFTLLLQGIGYYSWNHGKWPLIFIFQNLNDPVQGVSELDKQKAMAMAIVPICK